MKHLDHLLQRVQQIQRQQAPGVCMIVPAEDGHHLIVTTTQGHRRETVYATEGEARTAYRSFLQAHHATDTDHTLIIIDM